MKQFLMIGNVLVLLTPLVSSLASPDANTQELENKKIVCLLEKIERSQAVFIRNGSKYTSGTARSHLESKFKKATRSSWPFRQKKLLTVENFIDKLASKSSFSGKPYQMIINNKTVTTNTWLKRTLKSSCSKLQ